MTGPKLTFGDLQVGDRFISFPVDGDNSGHGGYLGSSRIFTKTRPWARKNAAREGDGVLSSVPDSMHVMKLARPV